MTVEANGQMVCKVFTPLGNPASVANLANANAVNGVSSAGLMTTVQPVRTRQQIELT